MSVYASEDLYCGLCDREVTAPGSYTNEQGTFFTCGVCDSAVAFVPAER